MDAQVKRQRLIDQLLIYFNQDMNRLVRLGNGLRMLGIDTSNEVHLDRIAQNPEHFMLIITYSDLGILDKMTDSVNILKG